MKGSDVLYSRYNQATEMLRYRRYAISAFILLIFMIGFTFYNSVAGSSANVESQWLNLRGQLVDRCNMVRKLADILEPTKFPDENAIKELRDSVDGFTKAETIKEVRNANFRVENAVYRVYSIIEEIPSIQENADFIMLQKEFSEKNKDIDYARDEFNDAVQSHNKKVKFLPYSLLAEQLNMTEKEYFRPYEKSRHINSKFYGKEMPELYKGEEAKEN